MHSVVPFIGKDALEKNEGLKNRIQYIIEEIFGHELRFVDAGSVFTLHRADPLEIFVPFTVAIEGAVSPQFRDDVFGPIQKLFPTSLHIQASAEQLPGILMNRVEELSLGHFHEAPETVHKVISLIYKHLADEKHSVENMAQELGLSKSNLNRIFHDWNGKGPNSLRHTIQMIESKRLIVSTMFRIKNISEAVGYSSTDSFDHAFRKFWGITPSQMREKSQTQPRLDDILQSMSQMNNLLSQMNNILSQND